MPESDGSPELRDHLLVLWRRKASIGAVLVVVILTALVYSLRQTPIYRSSAEVVVRAANLSPTSSSGDFVDMETEKRLAGSVQVADLALPELEAAGVRPGGLSVSTDGKAQALSFVASSESPVAAQRTAQTFAEAYLDFRREQVLDDLRSASDPLKQRIAELGAEIEEVQRSITRAPDAGEQTALQIRFNSLLTQRTFLEQKLNELILPEKLQVGRVIRPAVLPGSPSSPDHVRTVTFAVFLALSLGIGQAFVRDRLDDRVRDRRGLSTLVGAPVLGMVPRFRPKRKDLGRVHTVAQPTSPASEAFRRLRTNLMHLLEGQGTPAILVTSADVGEGKTTTAMNLAGSLALAGSRVVLVGADLRHPDLDPLLAAADKHPGLATVLQGDVRAERALLTTNVDRLLVLPAGSVQEGYAELLGSGTLRRALADLRAIADYVILDGPPVLRLADTLSLAPLVDAVLLVADAERATERSVSEAMDQLEGVGANVIGAVLNNHAHAWDSTYGTPYGSPPLRPRRPRGGAGDGSASPQAVEGITALLARQRR